MPEYLSESPYVLYSLRKLNEKEIEPKEMKRVLLKILEVTPDVPENRTLIDLVKNRILAYP